MTDRPGGDSEELIAIGRIAGVHGIRGEIKVVSLTDFPERFDVGRRMLMVSSSGELSRVSITGSRFHKGCYLLSLEGLTDRTAAEKLRGGYLKIEPDELTPLPAGEFYRFQLIGLTVFSESGENLGTVKEFLPTPGNLVLSVQRGEREMLVPYVDHIVREVDLERKRMTIHLMDGLLPED